MKQYNKRKTTENNKMQKKKRKAPGKDRIKPKSLEVKEQ